MSEKQQAFTIGALSTRTGVNIETIRYYERRGLMPIPSRTEGGHRLYRHKHLKRLISSGAVGNSAFPWQKSKNC